MHKVKSTASACLPLYEVPGRLQVRLRLVYLAMQLVASTASACLSRFLVGASTASACLSCYAQ